jgi:hypothetical protein
LIGAQAYPHKGTTGRLVVTQLNITDARCEALFASELRQSDTPTAAELAEIVSTMVRQHGVRGCASLMACEFGDHPEAAAARMRWVRHLVGQVSVAAPCRLPRLGGQPGRHGSPHDTGPLPRAA